MHSAFRSLLCREKAFHCSFKPRVKHALLTYHSVSLLGCHGLFWPYDGLMARNTKLASAIKAARLSQDDLARKVREAGPRYDAVNGCNRATVHRWLGGATPQPRYIRLLEVVLGKSAADLGFDDEPTGDKPAQPASNVQALRIAIAIVLRDDLVLLVRRRNEKSGISWGFVAGIVKPGEQAEDVAVRETLTETGVHCSVVEHIGGRLHPVTGVLCDYFRCNYLAGEAVNRDDVENAAVTWAPAREVSKFMERDTIYGPVLAIMEEDQHV